MCALAKSMLASAAISSPGFLRRRATSLRAPHAIPRTWVGWTSRSSTEKAGPRVRLAQSINVHGSRQTVAVGEDRGQLDCWRLDPVSGQLAVNAAAAPRAGVEPASLVLIQSQAGPADRPTGERPPSGGRLNSTVGDDRRANQPVDFTTGSGRDRL